MDSSDHLSEIDSTQFKFEYSISDLSFPSLNSNDEEFFQKSLEVSNREKKCIKLADKNIKYENKKYENIKYENKKLADKNIKYENKKYENIKYENKKYENIKYENKKLAENLVEGKMKKENILSFNIKPAIPREHRPFEYKRGHEITNILSELALNNFFTKIFGKGSFQTVDIFKYYHFKYSILSLKNRDIEIDIAILKKEMKIRESAEYSLFRRIYEGDGIPTRNFTFQIIKINQLEKYLTLFDGFFEQRFFYSKILEREIISQKITQFSKINVFSPKYKKQQNFYESYYEINFNSYELCDHANKIGLHKNISFIKNFKDINKKGGPVSAINIKIVKICGEYVKLKYKHLEKEIDCSNIIHYEREIEKFYLLLEKFKEKNEEVIFTKYYNLAVQDVISRRQGILIMVDKNLDIKKNMELLLINVQMAHPSMGFGHGEYHQLNIGLRFFANKRTWCTIKK